MSDVTLNIDVDQVIQDKPITLSSKLTTIWWVFIAIGFFTFIFALLLSYPPELLWGAYYTNVIYWMGLSAGGIMTTVIYQIVRARWSPPVRRIGEANLAFLPWIFLLFLCTYFGAEYLFPWAREPMPGREWWMTTNFVYARFFVLFGLLYYLFYRYIRMSLRGDLGLLREKSNDPSIWKGYLSYKWTRCWQGTDKEVKRLQVWMSRLAPVIVFIYVMVYTFFATEMIVGMDTIWFSNMFGGFNFVGNIYMGWASTALISIFLLTKSDSFERIISSRQFWDLGMLCFGFCMLWGYLFFAQFLPQWYGNMPEETQWLIIRTRIEPWNVWGWVTFSMCFVVPFILLLSRDLKRTPRAFAVVCSIILLGIWCEKYITVMPQMSPKIIPFGVIEVGLFLGFLGIYGMCIQGFLKRFPYLPVSHPLTRGSVEW